MLFQRFSLAPLLEIIQKMNAKRETVRERKSRFMFEEKTNY